VALSKSYVPKMDTFEQELMETYKIEEKRKRKPTYWY